MTLRLRLVNHIFVLPKMLSHKLRDEREKSQSGHSNISGHEIGVEKEKKKQDGNYALVLKSAGVTLVL